MNLQKIQIKLRRGSRAFWAHLCYVPEEVKANFDSKVNTKYLPSNHWVEAWAEEDFGWVILGWLSEEELRELKKLIQDKYKDEYPELHLETNTDRQGWVRVWYTQHMNKELEKIGL